MKAHRFDVNAHRFGEPQMRVGYVRSEGAPAHVRIVHDIWETCSYCGSVSVAKALEFMRTKGVRYSGADWKGGPHKFYFDDIPCSPYETVVSAKYDGKGHTEYKTATRRTRNAKLYAEHFKDATPDEIKEWNVAVAPRLGVAFMLDAEGDIKFKAVRGQWQTWGVAGIVRSDLPTVPRPEPGSGQEAMRAWRESADCLFGPRVPSAFIADLQDWV